MNELSMQEQETILSLLRLGWSRRRIARETGHRRETITRYGVAAGLLAPTPIADSKPATEAEVPADSKPAIESEVPADSKPATESEVPTDSKSASEAEVPAGSKPAIESEVPTGSAAATPAKSRSSCEGHRAFITAEIGKGRNGTAIFQDLVEHHGYEGSYDAVKRFVRPLVSRTPKLSCRFETLPGQDYVEYRVMLSPSASPFIHRDPCASRLCIIPPRYKALCASPEARCSPASVQARHADKIVSDKCSRRISPMSQGLHVRDWSRFPDKHRRADSCRYAAET
jgi:hypothetical protein